MKHPAPAMPNAPVLSAQTKRCWSCARRLYPLLLLGVCLNLRAQELSLLGGITTQAGLKDSSYGWQIDYRQDFQKYFASSIAYINEGHMPGHYRDGTAWEAWGNLPFWNDRAALSLGAGASRRDRAACLAHSCQAAFRSLGGPGDLGPRRQQL